MIFQRLTHGTECEVPGRMTYVITEPCVGVCDMACVDVCPADAIHGPLPLEEIRSLEDRKNLQMFIDPDSCIDCDACVSECPVAAIYPEDEVPAEWQDYVEKNAAFFR